MKDKMFEYFSANLTRRHINILDSLVNRYNNTKHSSIKMPLVEASKNLTNVMFLEISITPYLNFPKYLRQQKSINVMFCQ